MDMCITNHIGLMNFFQDWALQDIVDFYYAERDFLGTEYCRMIDHHHSKEKGIFILKNIILEYPKAFNVFIKKCCLETPAELALLINTESLLHEEKEKAATDFSIYLLGDKCDRNLKIISEALSKGFLFEWIACHIENKEEFINKLKMIEDHQMFGYKNLEYDFEEWQRVFRKKQLTRQEIIKNYQFREYCDCYLYRRIYLGFSLEVIFYALNVCTSLPLSNRKEYFDDAINYYSIGNDVQKCYEYQCNTYHRRDWDKELRFSASICASSEIEVIRHFFNSIPDTYYLKRKKDKFVESFINYISVHDDFKKLILYKTRGSKANKYNLDTSLLNVVGVLMSLGELDTCSTEISRKICEGNKEEANQKKVNNMAHRIYDGKTFGEKENYKDGKKLYDHIGKILSQMQVVKG